MIKKNLVVAVDKYTDRDGKERTKWATIGQVHESQNGKEYITLDRTFNLAGVRPQRRDDGTIDDRVFVNLFEPKGRQESPQGQDLDNEFEPDIPF